MKDSTWYSKGFHTLPISEHISAVPRGFLAARNLSVRRNSAYLHGKPGLSSVIYAGIFLCCIGRKPPGSPGCLERNGV
ncbi:hypothetical protein BJX65DRAFT_191139 [Aspergillus insuetus]